MEGLKNRKQCEPTDVLQECKQGCTATTYRGLFQNSSEMTLHCTVPYKVSHTVQTKTHLKVGTVTSANSLERSPPSMWMEQLYKSFYVQLPPDSYTWPHLLAFCVAMGCAPATAEAAQHATICFCHDRCIFFYLFT